jgi:hypothetical protein
VRKEIAVDYGNIGACKEATDLLKEGIALGEPYSSSPIDEYSKFGEDGTQSQRLAQVFYLSGLVHYAKGDLSKANEEFAKAVKANQNMICPKQFIEK